MNDNRKLKIFKDLYVLENFYRITDYWKVNDKKRM